jgi:hypothetical protein
MRVFIGYGYNERDKWIERDVFPILEAMNLEIVNGKDMHGDVLQEEVKERIEYSDGLIGFSTLRQGQKKADFGSHIWVRDEMAHALALKKRVVEIREKGVNIGEGLVGNRQRIEFDPKDRLRCVAELAKVVSVWSMRRPLLVPTDVDLEKRIHRGEIDRPQISRTGYYYVVAKTTRKVLDVRLPPAVWLPGQDLGPMDVHQVEQLGIKNQHWYPVQCGVGSYYLFVGHSGKCLDLHLARREERAKVVEYSFNGSDAQRWELRDAADGWFYIISAASKKALHFEDHSDAVYQLTVNGSDNQKWRFEPVYFTG